MRLLKTAGIVALVLWMAWASFTLIQVKSIALEACGIAAVHGVDADGGIRIPVVCPDLAYSEVKQAKSN